MSEISNKFIEPINETPSIDKLEKWIVIALPEKKCQELDASNNLNLNLNNLIERTKLEFEKNISELGASFSEINNEIEIDIRIKSNTLKDDINILESAGNKNADDLLSYKKKVLKFDAIKFQASNDFCESLLKDGLEKINVLYQDLQDLEKIRSDKYKIILKESYGKMENCSYKLPSEIQLYFEDQIIQINKVILSNLRNYKELHLNLTLSFTNIIKLIIHRIINYQENWRTLVIEEIKNRLKMCDYTDDDIKDFFEKYGEKTTSELIELFLQIEEAFNDPNRMNPKDLAWYKETNPIVEDIEITISDLLTLYGKAAEQFEITNIITQYLDRPSIVSSVNEYRSTQKLLFKQLLCEASEFEINRFYSREELEEMWKDTLREILQYTHMKYEFLKDLEHLWRAHGKRIDDIKLTISTELNQIIEKNDKNFQEKHEQTLNIAIDTVRQEMNEKKVEKSLKKVTKILNKMINALNEIKGSEFKVINKYNPCIENENLIITKEMTIFLTKYSHSDVFPEVKVELGLHSPELYQRLQDVIPDLENIVIQESEILIKMKKTLQTYAQDQLELANEWMHKRIEKSQKKFDVKLEFHTQRFDRIKLDIVDVRIAELKKHQEMFDLHKTAIDNHLKSLQECLKDFEKEKTAEINEFVLVLKTMSQDQETVKTTTDAEIYLKESTIYSEQMTVKFMESVESFSNDCFQKINQILTSNYDFLQNIKLFHEGGNFNAKEAKILSKKIATLESSIQKRAQVLKMGINALQKKLNKSIEIAASQCSAKRAVVSETIKFIEKIDGKIHNIQQLLKNEVYGLKYKRKMIDTIYERVKQLQSTDDFSKAACVIKYCKEIIIHCNQFMEYLKETDTPSRIYNVNLRAIEVTTPSVPAKKTQGKPKETKDSKKKDITLEDFELYDFFDNRKFKKFMNIINHDLKTAFTELQDTVKTFYALEYELDPKRIALTFEEFMNNVLPKFKYYYLQCLDIWVKEIKEFSDFTTKFLNNCEEYCRNFLHAAHHHYLNIFKENMDDYMRNIKNIEKLGFTEIREVHNELKPLYGYPGNKKMLEELENRVQATMENCKHNFESSLEPFFDCIEEYLLAYHNKMAEVSLMITDFKQNFFEGFFCSMLIQQAKHVFINTNFENFSFNLEDIISTWENENVKNTSETNLSEIINTLEEDVRVQILEEEARIYESQFEDIKNKYSLSWFAMVKTWEIDVKKVTDLYTVKYS